MKKKISILLMICLVIPVVLLFSACGDMKSVAGKTFVYSKCTVTGNVKKADVEETYKGMYIVFEESTYSMYTSEDVLMETYSYAIKNNTIYEVDEDNKLKEDGFKLKISGSQIIIELTESDGTFKIFLKN